MGSTIERGRAMVALAGAQLRHHRVRTALAVLGVALAALLVVLLGGVGQGAVTSGGDAIDWFDRDLWVTAGAVELRPGAVGGVANPIHGAHELSRELEARPDVGHAQAVAFQSVYVGTDADDLDTVVGVGIGGDAARLRIAPRFNRRDRHYANGTYDGPMTGRVVLDERTAARLGVGEGETVHVGATVERARRNEFTVVGTPNDLSNLLGAPTVGMHLAELQAVSGTTGTDPAAHVTVTLAPGAEPAAVARDIERRHEGLEARTGGEQLRATVGQRPAVVAGAAAPVLLAVAAALALVVTVTLRMAHQQRRQLAALRATGVSAGTLAGVVLLQGALVGVAGGVAGVLAAVPAAAGLNRVVEGVTGFPDLVVTPPWLLAAGLGLAVAVSVGGAAVAGRYASRLAPLDVIER